MCHMQYMLQCTSWLRTKSASISASHEYLTPPYHSGESALRLASPGKSQSHTSSPHLQDHAITIDGVSAL